jgi:hypothetical protein
MSFSDKIDDFFTKFSLGIGSAPTENLVYLYADYVELVALFSGQNYVSSSDIIDRLTDEGVFQQVDKAEFQAAANDSHERRVESIFRLINERALLFNDDYPFIIYDTDKIIIKEENNLSNRNKVYIYLLISSSLNIFPDFQHTLTMEFEELCMHVLKNYLPSHAVVKSFGKKSDYKGTARKKISLLANDMRIRIEEDGFAEISSKGTQEKGLDLIGWIPFGDNVANYISILGQCACGKDWNKKLNETSRYNNYMKFHRLHPIHSMFIPYSLVSYQKNTFFRNDDITERLIFERKRILNLLTHVDFFDTFESKVLVDKCVSFVEGVV